MAMTNRPMLLTAALLGMLLLSGCGNPGNEAAEEEPIPEQETVKNKTEEKDPMKITIGEYQFTVSLEDNETAAVLCEHLPLTLDMSELNGNEKYIYLPFSLPTDAYSPGTIQTGDVMLFGDSCLVVFYKSFSTPYSYTRIGHIDDPTELQAAVGTGGVQMVFEN